MLCSGYPLPAPALLWLSPPCCCSSSRYSSRNVGLFWLFFPEPPVIRAIINRNPRLFGLFFRNSGYSDNSPEIQAIRLFLLEFLCYPAIPPESRYTGYSSWNSRLFGLFLLQNPRYSGYPLPESPLSGLFLPEFPLFGQFLPEIPCYSGYSIPRFPVIRAILPEYPCY